MTQSQTVNHGSVDPAEVEQFSRIADEWWEESGKFKPLHQINPLRIGYIKQHLCHQFNRDVLSLKPFEGLSLLDVGCGGGLICEPMARLGAQVDGVDASERNIKVASLHAERSGLTIDYRTTTAEALVELPKRYDIVLALEIIEHVNEPMAFIASCAALVKPGGLLVMTTINRTAKAFAFAIVGAEYVLRLLPRGTHNWQKFVKPSQMATGFRDHGLEVIDTTGMVLHPLKREWQLSDSDIAVNYLMTGRKSI